MSNTTPKPAKAMSSRLLTMKFMQRAAASSPVSSAPSTPDQPSAKRRRTSEDFSPSAADISALADQKAVAAALAEEERIREAAIERQAAQAGDTRWVLSFEDTKQQSAVPKNTLRVVKTGYAGIDNTKPIVTASIHTEPIAAGAGGRRSFGKFNRTIEKLNNPLLEDSSDDSSDDEDSEKDEDDLSDDSEQEDDGTSALIKEERLEAAAKAKAERKAAKKAAKKEASRLADLRKKKHVNLNNVTSISGSGGGSGGNPGPCYTCGQKGHMSRDCPKGKGDRRRSGEDFRGQPSSKKAKHSR